MPTKQPSTRTLNRSRSMVIKFPEALWNTIEDQAKRERRSFAQMVKNLCEDAINQQSIIHDK